MIEPLEALAIGAFAGVIFGYSFGFLLAMKMYRRDDTDGSIK